MKGLERRYNIEHRLSDLLNVLHRPIDIASIGRHQTKDEIVLNAPLHFMGARIYTNV